MTYIFIYIGLFLIHWFIFYGFSFAYWQGEFGILAEEQYKKDRKNSILYALILALNFLVGWFVIAYLTKGFKHGFKLK